MLKVVKIVTYYAPIAFFGIFADLVATYGPQMPPPGTPLMPTELSTATRTTLTNMPTPSKGTPNTPRTKAIFKTQETPPATTWYPSLSPGS